MPVLCQEASQEETFDTLDNLGDTRGKVAVLQAGDPVLDLLDTVSGSRVGGWRGRRRVRIVPAGFARRRAGSRRIWRYDSVSVEGPDRGRSISRGSGSA